MNERGLRVLEQYDFKVLGTRRGRGSFICETDQGLKLVTEASGQAGRLQFQNRLLYQLRGRGYERVDCIVENREGKLITVDKDETAYLVKDWFEGRECDTRNEEDIRGAVRNLAGLHRLMRMEEEEKKSFVGDPLETELTRRIRELKKVRSFIMGRQGKNVFERTFLESCPVFLEQAAESLSQIRSASLEELRSRSLSQGCLCHGEYNQHHILMSREGMATIDFSRCRYDIQMVDLYQFLRKILEKQNWSLRTGMGILEEYDKEKGIGKPERDYLRIRLAFPEKFWKLANHYYNHNKAWIPGKHVEKLEMLNRQQEKRNLFLRILE